MFEGALAENIAERTFKDILAKTPQKPQAHYLLGYLREEQGRFKEALNHYRTAVKLDPDYVNAWTRLHSLSESIALPVADNDAAVLNQIRLQPSVLHLTERQRGVGGVGDVSDLKALWQTVENLGKEKLPEPPAVSYPLPASKITWEKTMAELRRMQGGDWNLEDFGIERGTRLTKQTIPHPAQVIAGQPLFAHICNAITQEAQSQEMEEEEEIGN